MMALKKQRNNLRVALSETAEILSTLQDEDSCESSFLKIATFQHVNKIFQQHIQTRNLCSEDVDLPLEPLNASNEYTVVWLHCDKDLDNDIKEDTILKLQYVFNHIEIFNSLEKCVDFLRQLDSTTTRLFLITSCFYDGMALGTVSPLADRNSELACILRHFKFEHHVHGHASQWSSPNYVHSLSEIFKEAKFDDDALKLFYDAPSDPIYQVIWLRSVQNEQVEQRLRCVFSSLEVYDDQQLCFNYIDTIDPTKVHIYFIIDRPTTEFEWKKVVKEIYEVPSNIDDINRFVLQIRNDVRSESGNPFHCIERSARRPSDKYAPFVSLMAHLDLYVALSRHRHDRTKMKEEMLAACRLLYHNNNAYLKMIDKFETEYDSSIKGNAIRWYTNDSFVYRLINRVLRTGNPDFIHRYRFFINDLYDELLSIDRQYCDDFDELVVYRGQCITETELSYLQNNVGQLLTLSSFTSTTIDRNLALIFGTRRDNMIGVLFEIHLNITLDNTRPFAYVSSYSAMPDELEVLISMGTIFKLMSVTHDSDNDKWTIVLDLCQQHSCDIKNLVSSHHNKAMHFSNFKPIPFRRSSTPTTNTFDANLKQFNRTYDFYGKKVEKTVSLPTLLKNETNRPIIHAHSLRSKHGLSPSLIKVNMDIFQQKQRQQQQRKRNRSFSWPCLSSFNLSSFQRRYSLPILVTMPTNGFPFHIKPRFLFEEVENNGSLNIDNDPEDGLFVAGIYDTLMVFNYMSEHNTDNAVSLKEQVDELRHELRKTFNLEKGRWCSEF